MCDMLVTFVDERVPTDTPGGAGRREFADAYVDDDRHRLVMEPPPRSVDTPRRLDWFRVHHRVTVRPEQVTFAGRLRTEVRARVKTIAQETRNRSLAAVLIHDL